MKLWALLVFVPLAGCTPPAPIVRTETVEVTKYVKQPVDPALTAPIVVTEPTPSCHDGTTVVFCAPELILARLMWKAAVQSCNDDRKAIRDGQDNAP
jgi:hypothetical protein